VIRMHLPRIYAPWRMRRRGRRGAQSTYGLRPGPVSHVLRVPRMAALVAISVLVAGASLVSFAESYRALYLWAHEHGLHGVWAAVWPLQVDVFIAVGELALFVALADGWSRRSRVGAWFVTLAGLGVSVAGNVGHVATHTLAVRATAAVPPLAAASALAVGLGVLKRVVAAHHQAGGPRAHLAVTLTDTPGATVAEHTPNAPETALPGRVQAHPGSVLETVPPLNGRAHLEHTPNAPAGPVAGRTPDAPPERTSDTPARRARTRVRPHPERRSDAVTEVDASAIFAAELANREIPSLRAICRLCRVGIPRAREIRAHLQAVIGQNAT
jgi:hypothetical protein